MNMCHHLQRICALLPLLVVSLHTDAAESTSVHVDGDLAYSIHGVDEVKETLFGLNMGSGGSSGREEVNATWFRNTSITLPSRYAVEDPDRPGFADAEWLITAFKDTKGRKNAYNRILLFHPTPDRRCPDWVQPFGSVDDRLRGSQAWGEIAAQYVADYEAQQEGSGFETRWEFGNELMYEHYIRTARAQMDENRCGPGIMGDETAEAYRDWVFYGAKAIKDKAPDAKILAGSGNMLLEGRDWWGWKYWDKPFLDQCAPYVDYYATHWYSVDPENILISASLVYAYTKETTGRGIPTHVTEYGMPSSGVAAEPARQWHNTLYCTDVILRAFRDPDKIDGLYMFLWNDPKYMNSFQVKDSLLGEWLTLVRNLRGKRIYTETSGDDVHVIATLSDGRMIVLLSNRGAESRSVDLNLKAPGGARINEVSLETLSFDESEDDARHDASSISGGGQSVSGQIVLPARSFALATVTLEGKGKPTGTVTVDEYFSPAFFTPAGEGIKIAVDKLQDHALVRLIVDCQDSQWRDFWLVLNGKYYPVTLDLFRRRDRLFEIPVPLKELQSVNTLSLLVPDPDLWHVVTASIETSNRKLKPFVEQAIQTPYLLQLPAQAITDASFPASVTIDGKKQEVNEWILPPGWQAHPSTGGTYEIATGDSMRGPDWYAISAKVGARTLRGQVHMSPAIISNRPEETIVIDGEADEWDSVSAYEIRRPVKEYHGLTWPNGQRKDEGSGKSLKTAWTPDGFYFLASFPYDSSGNWLDLFFDLANNDSRFRYDNNDHQFMLHLDREGNGQIEQVIWSAAIPVHNVPVVGSRVASKRKGKLMQVEGFIPASAFHVWDPQPGEIIGFDFRINHKLEWYGRGYEQMVYIMPITESWGREQVLQNPAVWGNLMFVHE